MYPPIAALFRTLKASGAIKGLPIGQPFQPSPFTGGAGYQ